MKRIYLTTLFFLSLSLLGCMNQSRCGEEFNELLREDSSEGCVISLGVVKELTDATTLPIGSNVLLNATGALELTNQKYSWNGSWWEGDGQLIWNKDSSTATLLAIYPFQNHGAYSASMLYGTDGLKDILYDYQELSCRQDIELHFKHRFSRISISASAAVNQQLTAIVLSVPCIVDSLSPFSGAIDYDFTQTQRVNLSVNEEALYQFIVPPADELELNLLIEWNGLTSSHSLGCRDFQSNRQYNYHLKSVAEAIGIQTVDDFIAFGKLINGEAYEGERRLADFGETVDGVTTYYLLNDLEFAPEDSLRLSSIGRYDYFNDHFEGNNHTLRGLCLQNIEGVYGLFYQVGDKGVVRNLHVADSHIQGSKSSYLTSFVASYNAGVIDHCSVTNCVASVPANSLGGLIVGRSIGTILNSWSWNCSLDFQNNSAVAGIVGNNNGYLYNSFAGNLAFKQRTNSLSGGICSTFDANIVSGIENCYYYGNPISSSVGGILYSAPLNCIGTVRCCFTNNTPVVKDNEAKIVLTTNYRCDENFIYTKGGEPCHVVDGLNEWVVGVGAQLTAYSFKRWEVGSDGTPRLLYE